jgi:hypothetical protein
MKNRILYLILFVFVAVGFSSCDKDTTGGLTSITFYPDIVILGEPYVYLEKDSDYTDAGASATENGVEIEVVATSNLDVTTPGSYAIGYTAKNSDGFSKTVYRYIMVYDGNMSTEDISGAYTGHVIRNNDPAKEYSGMSVTLTATDAIPGATGIYEISDWISGFYAVGYAYGDAYAFTGLIQINGDNEVVLISMDNLWGDPFDSVDGTYNSGTGTIAYDASWLEGTYIFAVDLTKN